MITKAYACGVAPYLKRGLADHPADKAGRNRRWRNRRAPRFKGKPQSPLSRGHP